MLQNPDFSKYVQGNENWLEKNDGPYTAYGHIIQNNTLLGGKLYFQGHFKQSRAKHDWLKSFYLFWMSQGVACPPVRFYLYHNYDSLLATIRVHWGFKKLGVKYM